VPDSIWELAKLMLETKGGAGATGCALCASACCDNGGNDAGKPSGSLQLPMFLQYSDSSATGSAAQMGQNMANIVQATWRCADSPSIFSSRIVLPSTARSFNHLEFFAPGRVQLQLYLQNSAGRSHPLVCRFFLACDVGGMPCALHDIMFFYHSQSVRTATIHPLCKSPSTAC
jgi:hypothetical protein